MKEIFKDRIKGTESKKGENKRILKGEIRSEKKFKWEVNGEKERKRGWNW